MTSETLLGTRNYLRNIFSVIRRLTRKKLKRKWHQFLNSFGRFFYNCHKHILFKLHFLFEKQLFRINVFSDFLPIFVSPVAKVLNEEVFSSVWFEVTYVASPYSQLKLTFLNFFFCFVFIYIATMNLKSTFSLTVSIFYCGTQYMKPVLPPTPPKNQKMDGITHHPF